MISFVLPTHNRPIEVARTVKAVSDLGINDAEMIVVDNASSSPAGLAGVHNRLRLNEIVLPQNIGAAARNIGAREACHDWVVMLDDDSHPLDAGVLDAIADASPRIGAIAGDISLADGSRERGGLPEVFVGCGAAVRRELFLSLGGYDQSFDYYAEEYDFCAKLIASGHRVAFDSRFRVLHRKVETGRDFGAILHRLVRNNAWVLARYAPDADREQALGEMLDRYVRIAESEGVTDAFASAQAELRRTIDDQSRSPLSQHQWERFTGAAAVREALEMQLPAAARTAAIVEAGKGEPTVRQALAERGLILVGDVSKADAVVIGTLSPGPMLDAAARWANDARLAIPWITDQAIMRDRAAAA